MKKLVYIPGPISHHAPEERRKAFKIIQKYLEAKGYDTVNPMENGLPMRRHTNTCGATLSC